MRHPVLTKINEILKKIPFLPLFNVKIQLLLVLSRKRTPLTLEQMLNSNVIFIIFLIVTNFRAVLTLNSYISGWFFPGSSFIGFIFFFLFLVLKLVKE